MVESIRSVKGSIRNRSDPAKLGIKKLKPKFGQLIFGAENRIYTNVHDFSASDKFYMTIAHAHGEDYSVWAYWFCEGCKAYHHFEIGLHTLGSGKIIKVDPCVWDLNMIRPTLFSGEPHKWEDSPKCEAIISEGMIRYGRCQHALSGEERWMESSFFQSSVNNWKFEHITNQELLDGFFAATR